MKTEVVRKDLVGKTYAEVVATLTTASDSGNCCGFALGAWVDVPDELFNQE